LIDDDVYEPLAFYRDTLKAEYARNTADLFEDLLRQSEVDASANAATVADIRVLDGQLAEASASSSRWRILRALVVTLAVAGMTGVMLYILPLIWPDLSWPAIGGHWALACLAAAVPGVLLITARLNPIIRKIEDRLRMLREQHTRKSAQAWQQMVPLNRLYDWGTVASLVQKTVPRIALDPYFSRGRLDELRQTFDWDDSFNRDKSVLFAQSGAINGNPFVLAETLNFRMGAKEYNGSLDISWQEDERYTGPQGQRRTRRITRHETLRASVTKPAPGYSREKLLIYGNEAAPTLSFSRSPSHLSGLDDGAINNWRKARKIKKLEALSRNLDDDSGYTIMANREFDALFNATDRDDEIQFRLLFTPLAQHQMLALLKDKTVGYGDDFMFIKSRMTNVIYPAHLANIDISASPSLFHHYDLAAARKVFNDYNNDYFKALFFALAPLLTIPLYQQHRSHADIYKDVYGKTASFWEHESIANFHGEKVFQHPDSVTSNILKTEQTSSDNSDHTVFVTAHGFRGHNRTDYVGVRGGDGRTHKVPVPWIEYEAVSRTSSLAIRETDGLTRQDYEQQTTASPDWQAFFRQWKIEPRDVSFRRSILSFTPP
jgi:hypothetical protein